MAREKNIFQRYRIAPLLLLGIIAFVLLVTLSLLGWSLITFGSMADVPEKTAAPAVIYFGAIFVSCALMTALIKGGTVFPSAILSLLAAAATLLLAEAALVSVGSVLIKCLLSLFFGVLGFTLTKLLFISRRPQQPQLHSENEPAALSSQMKETMPLTYTEEIDVKLDARLRKDSATEPKAEPKAKQ